MSVQIKADSAVFLYNPKSKKVLSVEQYKNLDFNNRKLLVALPRASSKLIHADLLILRTPQMGNDILFTENPVQITCTQNNTGDRIFLQPTEQGVVYFEQGQKSKWRFRKKGSKKQESLQYGVEYSIQNLDTQKYLTVSGNKLTTKLFADSWVILPTTEIFTCDSSGGCITTVGYQNLTSLLTCSGKQCKTRFGQSIFFNEKECQTKCSGNTLTETKINNTTKTTATKIIIIVLLTLILIGAIFFSFILAFKKK